MSETILEVQHLGKSFGNNEILKDIDFSVKPKDVTCIIGPSGSGKSTLLRCMNLLETPSCGEIRYHGTNIMDKHVNVPEYRSKVGMVFQNFNLFNNMTVLKNCTVGQEKVLKKSKEEGCTKMYMRTLQRGQSMSYSIAVKHGFKVLENVEQSVIQERVSVDRAIEDCRIFLEKDLE